MEPETIREIVVQLTPPTQYVFQLLVEKQIRYNLAQIWCSGAMTVVCAVIMLVCYIKIEEDDDYWIGFILSGITLFFALVFLIFGIIERPIPEAVVLGRWLQ
jgi:hypothetical protein